MKVTNICEAELTAAGEDSVLQLKHKQSAKVDCEPSSTASLQWEKRDSSPLENGDKTRFYYEKLVNLEISLSLTVLVNLAIVLSYTERVFSSDRVAIDEGDFLIGLYVAVVCTIAEIFISLSRQLCDLRFHKEQKILHSDQTLLSTGKLWTWLLEVLIFTLQPNPWCCNIKLTITASYNDYVYDFYINQLLSLLSLIRFYALVRLFLVRSAYMNPRSQRLCKMHGCEANYEYALKCMFKDSPALLILLFFGASIVLFSLAIQICERPLHRAYPSALNLQLFANAVWFTIITMTTVGFGDYYPSTPFGRLIILFVVIWGIFVVSIMVVVVTNTLLMDKAEKKTIIVLKRLEVAGNLRQAAGKLIGYVLSNVIRKSHQPTAAQQKQQRKQSQLRQQFVSLNSQFKNLYDSDDTYEQISQKFEQLNSDIKILNDNQEQLIWYIHENLQYDEVRH